MKLSKLNLRSNKINISKKQAIEDMRYLQKKITGRSVYANIKSAYNRNPKHKSRRFENEFNIL
jgi:hypothetical protein